MSKDAPTEKTTVVNVFAIKIFYYLIIAVSLLTVIHLTLQYINIETLNEEYGPYYELTNRLDFDDESSVHTWFGQFLFIITASLGILISFVQRNKKARNIWLVITSLAFLGSIDEVASIHENILQSVHLLFFDEFAPTFLANAWIIILPFIAVVLWIFIMNAIKLIPARTIVLMVISFLIFIFGSVFIDILTSVEGYSSGFLTQGLLVSIEESLEMAGLTMLIYTLCEYLETYHKNKIINAINALKY